MQQAAILGITLFATALSTGLAVSAQRQQAKAAKAAARFNAQELENAAIREDLEGREERRRKRIADRRTKAIQRVSFAKSGVIESEGTPLEVLAETATNLELSINDSLRASQARATGLRGQAGLELFEGEAEASGFRTGAGITLLSGASSFGGQFNRGRRTTKVK